MRLRCLGMLAVAVALTVGRAAAQTASAEPLPPGPDIELGIDGAVANDFYDGSARPWGPRLILNLSPDTAVALFGEVAVAKGRATGYSRRSRLMGFDLRQTVARHGSVSGTIVAGSGVSYRRKVYPQPTITIRSQATGEITRVITSPDRVVAGLVPAVILGGGLSVRLSRHLSVHQDLRFVLAGDASELRAQIGFAVPVGRYPRAVSGRSRRAAQLEPAPDAPPEPAAPPPVPLTIGQSLWLTTVDGRETWGVVLSTDGSAVTLETRGGTRVTAFGDIRQVDRPDPVGDGFRRGAWIGALAGGAVLTLANVGCDGDCMSAMGPAVVGGAFGAGIGGAFGGVIDGLASHRRTIYRRAATTSVALTPIVTGRSLGARTTIGW